MKTEMIHPLVYCLFKSNKEYHNDLIKIFTNESNAMQFAEDQCPDIIEGQWTSWNDKETDQPAYCRTIEYKQDGFIREADFTILPFVVKENHTQEML